MSGVCCWASAMAACASNAVQYWRWRRGPQEAACSLCNLHNLQALAGASEAACEGISHNVLRAEAQVLTPR